MVVQINADDFFLFVWLVVQMQMKKMCLCENYGANANAETIFVSGRLCAELPSQTKALLLQRL